MCLGLTEKKNREIQLICKRIPSKAQGYLRANPPYSVLDCWAQLFVENHFWQPWSKQTCNKHMNDFVRTLSFSKEAFPSGSRHEFSGVGQSKLEVKNASKQTLVIIRLISFS